MSVYYNEFDPKAAAWLREMVRWGQSDRGKFELDDGTGSGAGGCDGGMCGI